MELRDNPLSLSAATTSAAQTALDDLRRADLVLTPNLEPLARLLLRIEGIASSSIEGVRAPLQDVVRADRVPMGGGALWIVDNLRAVEAALTAEALSVEVLHRWHRSLMGHSDLSANMIGAFRTSPGWIGGTSPLDAAYVPPPSEHVPRLMDDLVAFANDTPCDAITHAAVVHAQFETIHPYGDGNGRLGRALVGWVLRRRGVIERFPPPISVLIARDAGGYTSGLYQFRESGPDRWVRWFAKVASQAARQSHNMITEVEGLLEGWAKQTSHLRADAAARRTIALLPQWPVLNAQHLADELNVSTRAASNALVELCALGILDPYEASAQGRGKPANWFTASALLDAAQAWTG